MAEGFIRVVVTCNVLALDWSADGQRVSRTFSVQDAAAPPPPTADGHSKRADPVEAGCLNRDGERDSEIRALRERISRLGAAVLRTVRVWMSARPCVRPATALAPRPVPPYGMIATIDEAGQLLEFVTSGLTVDEYW